jgi:hypothetical protein
MPGLVGAMAEDAYEEIDLGLTSLGACAFSGLEWGSLHWGLSCICMLTCVDIGVRGCKCVGTGVCVC